LASPNKNERNTKFKNIPYVTNGDGKVSVPIGVTSSKTRTRKGRANRKNAKRSHVPKYSTTGENDSEKDTKTGFGEGTGNPRTVSFNDFFIIQTGSIGRKNGKHQKRNNKIALPAE
jgi:hypothetical protein